MFDKSWYKNNYEQLSRSPAKQKLWGFFGIQISYAYIGIGLVLFVFSSTRFTAVLIGIAAGVARGIVVELLLRLFPSPRPYQKFEFTPLGGKAFFTRRNKMHDAFPSGHSASLAAITTVLLLQGYVFLGAISLCFSLLAGCARVLLGYHWPRDIGWGWVLGAATGYIIYSISPYLLPYFALL